MALVLALVFAAVLAAVGSGWSASAVLLSVATGWWLWHDNADARGADNASYFRDAFEAMPVAMLACHSEGALVGWNRTAAELLGASPEQMDRLNLRTGSLAQSTGLWLVAEGVLRSGVTREFEAHGITDWGCAVQLRCRLAAFEHGGTRNLVVMMSDMSNEVADRKQAEARAAQALQGMSTLAGKMAHDFNNILASVTGYVAAAQQTELNAEAKQCLDAALAASARGEHVALQLSSLGVQHVTRRRPVEMRRVVRDALDALRPTLRPGIELNVVLSPEGVLVVGDPAELQQAVTTLAAHAARAMRAGPGLLAVELHRRQVGAGELAPALVPGDYICIRLGDGGPAADASQPTTHPFSVLTAHGDGADLELALAHAIVRNHHGSVTGRGAPGQGTTLELYLPAADPIRPAAPSEPALKPKVPRGEGQRVLVLDDEELIASGTARLLEHLGYDAESNHDPMDVAAAIRRDPAHYDLVITDESMPDLSGLDLAAVIRQIRPDLPILIMSGYGTDISPEKLQAVGVAGVVRKPARPDAIGLAVHRVLSGARREALSETA